MVMRSEEKLVDQIFDILPGSSTYDAEVPSTAVRIRYAYRTRAWHNMYGSKRLTAKAFAAQGYLPTLPYSDALECLVNSKVITVTGQLYTDPRSVFTLSWVPGTARHPVSFTDGLFPACIAEVRESLQSRLSGHGFNAYVSAFEAKKTAGMIGDAATRIATAYSHVRRGKFKAAAVMLGLGKVPRGVSSNEAFSNNWLQYRYGWRLVVLDINSLLKTLHDSLTDRPPIFRVSAVARRKFDWTSGSFGVPLNIFGAGPAAAYDESRTHTVRVEVRGGYTYSLSSVPLATGQAFGVINPLLVAWELIPYSFVVDWLTNVGSVLEGLTAFEGKNYLDGFLCKVIESETTYTWSNFRKTSGIHVLNSPGTIRSGPVVERRFNREQMVFNPSSLRLTVDLNVNRALDAIALIRQQSGSAGRAKLR